VSRDTGEALLALVLAEPLPTVTVVTVSWAEFVETGSALLHAERAPSVGAGGDALLVIVALPCGSSGLATCTANAFLAPTELFSPAMTLPALGAELFAAELSVATGDDALIVIATECFSSSGSARAPQCASTATGTREALPLLPESLAPATRLTNAGIQSSAAESVRSAHISSSVGIGNALLVFAEAFGSLKSARELECVPLSATTAAREGGAPLELARLFSPVEQGAVHCAPPAGEPEKSALSLVVGTRTGEPFIAELPMQLELTNGEGGKLMSQQEECVSATAGVGEALFAEPSALLPVPLVRACTRKSGGAVIA